MFTFSLVITASVLACLYLWLIYAPHRHPDALRLQGFLYAHRGLHDGNETVIENSMKAFSAAIEKGYGIELDIQLTADEQLVVHHDATLRRICREELCIADATYEELCRHPLPDGSCIPLFSDFLKLVDGRVPLIIELKHYHQPARTAQLAWEQLKDYRGPYCIESFHPLCVRWFRKHAPQVVRGQLAPGKKDKSTSPLLYHLLSGLLINCIGRPHFIAYECAHDRHFGMLLMKKLFRPMLAAWTVRDAQTLANATNDGYSMIIFERFTPEN